MGGCGAYVSDFTPIIKPLRGPTCMLKTSKISTQVEIASRARVWQKSLILVYAIFLIGPLLREITYLKTFSVLLGRSLDIHTLVVVLDVLFCRF